MPEFLDHDKPSALFTSGAQALTVRVYRGQRSAIVRVDGEADMASTARLDRELTGACARFRLVIVDCGGLTFLGSSGITALFDAHSYARSRGNEMRVVVRTAAVRAALRVSGGEAVLAVFSSMDKALAASYLTASPDDV